MEIKQLKEELKPHAYHICKSLYPKGKVESGNFKLGDLEGNNGRSLSVILNGDKAGQWTDFESGDHGDLFDLIISRKGCSIQEAMSWSAKEAGIRSKTVSQKIEKAQKKKFNPPRPPEQVNTEVLHAFLESRGFEDVGELCLFHKIYATESLNTDGTDLVFQFYSVDGDLTFLKHKAMNYDGKPGQCNQKNLKPILYGWHTVPKHERVIFITEGELDQIAARQLGFPALSLPSGASNMSWIEHEYENLGRFEDIAICTDQDEAGEKCAAELMRRLGDRCFRVKLPTKDINDLVLAYGYEEAREVLKKAFEDAKWKDPDQLRSVSEFNEDVASYFSESSDESSGWKSGWDKIDENDIRFRPHELIGLTGINGHGKSMWLNQLMINAMTQDNKVCIASMEMRPKQTLGRMVQQVTGDKHPTEQHQEKAMSWLEPNLWLFVDNITPKPEVLMECFDYAYKRYGINVFVIDSMTNMVNHEDSREQQNFMELLVNFKQSYPVTIFLATHSRKGENESKAPNKFDVKGSGAITDLADCFISLWKNKLKAEHLEYCESTNSVPDEKILKTHDVYLNILKNRNGSWEGIRGFTFHNQSCQYLEANHHKPHVYVKKPRAKDAPI
tara:strand:+ start:13052 stop:14896 length:1845 start_codon:yes stop_codon:yes gene_type:complete